MNLNSQIGELAGTIWRLVESKGSMSQLELKSSITASPYMIDFCYRLASKRGPSGSI